MDRCVPGGICIAENIGLAVPFVKKLHFQFLSGATVTVDLKGAFNETITGVTNALVFVSLVSSGTVKGNSTYT